jgi:hypothetical protein
MAESYDILGIDFEDGDLNDWDAIEEEGSNTVIIESASPIHGSYSAKCTFDGINNLCFLRKVFSPELTEMYARWYIRFPTGFSIDSGALGIGALEPSTGAGICYLRCKIANLSLDRLYYATDSGYSYVSTDSFTFQLDTDYYIEYYFKQSSGADDGIVEAKINGTSVALVENIDNDTLSVNRIEIGQTYSAVPSIGSTIIFDDLIINNATSGWPGAYSDGGGSIVPVIMHHRKLRQ